MKVARRNWFISEIVLCKTIANIRARPDAEATALGLVASRVKTANCLQTTGLAVSFGVVNMGLGSENPGMSKLEGVFSKGALKGKAGLVVESAVKAGLDPSLFAAVIAHETGSGTSNAIINYNNPAGIMDPKTNWSKLKKFGSLEEGLSYSAKNLKRRVDESGGNFAKLAQIYAPIGAGNDPKGMNSAWSSGVSKFYNLLAPSEIVQGAPETK